jgi:hypothetical protein
VAAVSVAFVHGTDLTLIVSAVAGQPRRPVSKDQPGERTG